MTEEHECEVAVIGAGIHGTSAAFHLAKAGKDTILVEQFQLPHTRGSSHGPSRIIRSINFSNPALDFYIQESFRKWKEIEKEAGEELMRSAPVLVVGNKDQHDMFAKVGKSIEQAGHSPEWMTPAEANERFGLHFPTDSVCFIDPSAGVLMADKCLRAMQRLFSKAGGRILDDWRVTEVTVTEDGSARVKSHGGMIKASSVVFCPGPWAQPVLAKIGIHIPLKVEKIGVFYWNVQNPDIPTTSFIDTGEPEGVFYGLPDLEYPGFVKLVFDGGIEIDPDLLEEDNNGDIRKMLVTYIKKKFPNLHPLPAFEETCKYTNTLDKVFVMDRHPKHSNLIFACGFSGSGFKIAPAVGETLCKMVLGKQPFHDIAPFSVSRFDSQGQA